MSYILEALKKADQERDVGAVPSLATPPQVRQPRIRSRRWPWLVVALLFVNVVLVAMLLLKDRDAGAPVADRLASETSLARIEEPPPRPVQRAREGPVAPDPAPESPSPTRIEPIKSGGGLVILPEPGRSQDSGPPLPAQEQPATGTDAAEAASDIMQLPNWFELPLEFRNRLDLPRLDLHVYAEEPRDRFILVNFKKYREGERLESGMVLEEIHPGGMVMSYRGKRFLIEK